MGEGLKRPGLPARPDEVAYPGLETADVFMGRRQVTPDISFQQRR